MERPPSANKPRAPRRPGRGGPSDTVRGKVRPHDPFELIRWLAFSQPDPRKAVAELVQNSLDAGARRIRLIRVRERGAPCLKILDDGEGVIPDLDRVDALKYIATHIGHSRKRDLSPEERLALMTQGQYGIGLLGFWSLGERLEMRTAVRGQTAQRLILNRDSPDYAIERLRGRLALDETWTEVVVVGLHREAQGALVGRRVADYLASELRGQLLARDVELLVEDRMSRGRALKEILVRPPRFLGERLEGLGPLELPGHPPVRLEIYLDGAAAGVEEPRGLSVYAAGTLVAESFHDLATLGLDHPPWTDPRLVGLVDFPALRVAPGSRRGIFVDAAAGAFALALARIEPSLAGLLDALDRRRTEDLDRSMIRDLQRAFRDFYRQQPRYAMLPVQHTADQPAAGESADAAGDGTSEGGAIPATGADERRPARPGARIDLLPPGPLEALRVRPDPLRAEVGSTRQVRAVGLDATGRPIDEPLALDWQLLGEVGTLEPMVQQPATMLLRAASQAGAGTLRVSGVTADRRAAAEVEVEVVEELPAGAGSEGIPEPELVHQPGAAWRSRMWEERWQVNTGHRDYRAAAERPGIKLRYLATLFAKEIVLRSNQDPRLERPLEQLVEIATFADRNLPKGQAARRGRRREG